VAVVGQAYVAFVVAVYVVLCARLGRAVQGGNELVYIVFVERFEVFLEQREGLPQLVDVEVFQFIGGGVPLESYLFV
jgi:hypothetical protein